MYSDIALYDWEREATQKKFNEYIKQSRTLQDLLMRLQEQGYFVNLEQEYISKINLDDIEIDYRFDDGNSNHILLKCTGDLFAKFRLISSNESDRRHLFSKYTEEYDWFLKPELLHVYERCFICVTPWVSVYNVFDRMTASSIQGVMDCWREMLRHRLFYEDWESTNSTTGDRLRIIDIDSKLVTSENFSTTRRSDGFLRSRMLTSAVSGVMTVFTCFLIKSLKRTHKYTRMLDAECFDEWAEQLEVNMEIIERLAHQALRF